MATGNGLAKIENCEIISILHDKVNGGAIATTVAIAIVGCSFRNCSAYCGGSALFTINVTLESSTFLENDSEIHGTVFIYEPGELVTITIRSCFLQGAISRHASRVIFIEADREDAFAVSRAKEIHIPASDEVLKDFDDPVIFHLPLVGRFQRTV